MIILDENSNRADLEWAAIEAGLCDDTDGCDRVARMTDRELYEAIVEWTEAGNEAAP